MDSIHYFARSPINTSTNMLYHKHIDIIYHIQIWKSEVYKGCFVAKSHWSIQQYNEISDKHFTPDHFFTGLAGWKKQIISISIKALQNHWPRFFLMVTAWTSASLLFFFIFFTATGTATRGRSVIIKVLKRKNRKSYKQKQELCIEKHKFVVNC